MMLSGKIKAINEIQIIGTSGFKKRELVITTNEQYPQPLLIEFIQEKCELLNDFKIDEDVTISIDLRGREWVSPAGEIKYINSFQGWKIENNSITPQTPPPIYEDDLDDEDTGLIF